MLTKFSGEEWILTHPVEVTSPDQFIPLFTAFDSDVIYTHRRYRFNYILRGQGMYLVLSDEKDLEVSGKNYTAEEVRERLIKQFNYSYPDRYSVPLSYRVVKNNVGYGASGWNDLIKAFNGLSPCFYDGTYYALPGLVCKMQGSNYSSAISNLSSKQFLAHTILRRHDLLFALKPCALVLVKAKHIPLIRICQHLEQPFNIPFEDFKFLTINNSDVYEGRAIKEVLSTSSGFGQFISKSGVERNYVNKEVMDSYLIGPYSVPSKANLVELAKTVVEEQNL